MCSSSSVLGAIAIGAEAQAGQRKRRLNRPICLTLQAKKLVSCVYPFQEAIRQLLHFLPVSQGVSAQAVGGETLRVLLLYSP